MAVDFSQLRAIQGPQMMGSLPNNPPAAGALLGSGIANAVQGAQAAQLNNLNIQNAQMNIEDKQAARRDAAELKAAAQQGKDQLISTLMQQDPVRALQVMKAYEEIPLAIAQTQTIQEDVKKKGWENHDTTMMHLGDMATATQRVFEQTKDPVKANAFFQQALTFAPKAIADKLQEKYPEGWTPESGAVLTNLGQMAAANLASKSTDKKSDITTRLDEINETRRQAGLAPLTPEEKLKSQEAGLQKSVTQTRGQLSPSEQINVTTTADRLKGTASAANIATQQLGNYNRMEKLTNEAFAGKGAESKLKAQQVLDFLGVKPQKGVAATEALQGMMRDTQLVTQTLLKGSTSDRDMEIVEQVSPQLSNTKAGRELMLSAGKYKNTAIQQNNAFLNAWQNANNGSLDGVDEAWNNFIQSRNDFDPKTKKFNSEGISRKAWEPYLDKNLKTPISKGLTYNPATGKLE